MPNAPLPATLAQMFATKKDSVAAAQIARSQRDKLGVILKAKAVGIGDVSNEIGGALHRALDVKLVDVFLGAWTKLSAIAAFADTAKYPPGERHLIPIAAHRIESHHQPKVDVLIDGVTALQIPFDIALQIQFEAAVLQIEGGYVHAIKSGSCSISGTIACSGVPIAQKSTGRYAIPGELALRPPFAIARGKEPLALAAGTGGNESREKMRRDAGRIDRVITLSGIDDAGRNVQFKVMPATTQGESAWLIGRDSDQANFIIPSKAVSSRHARIRFTPEHGLEICDLGSSNGTLVDGEKLGRGYVSLQNVRKVAFGGFEMRVSRD